MCMNNNNNNNNNEQLSLIKLILKIKKLLVT